jgi:hypothetical protein
MNSAYIELNSLFNGYGYLSTSLKDPSGNVIAVLSKIKGPPIQIVKNWLLNTLKKIKGWFGL